MTERIIDVLKNTFPTINLVNVFLERTLSPLNPKIVNTNAGTKSEDTLPKSLLLMIEITIPTPGIIDIKLVEKSIIATTIKIILKIDAALADLLKIFSLHANGKIPKAQEKRCRRISLLRSV